MQKAFVFQKWTFYAHARVSVTVLPSCMWLLMVHVRPPVLIPLLLLLLYAQNAYFCVSRCIRFASLFLGIYSNASFHMHFTNAFPCGPLPPSWLRHGGLSSDCVKVELLCTQNACFIKILLKK